MKGNCQNNDWRPNQDSKPLLEAFWTQPVITLFCEGFSSCKLTYQVFVVPCVFCVCVCVCKFKTKDFIRLEITLNYLQFLLQFCVNNFSIMKNIRKFNTCFLL